MFGLGQQIGGDPVGLGVGIGNNDRFSRTGQPVDTDQPKYLAFGEGHEQVARAENLVNRFDRAGAIRERRNRLRAAESVDFRHADQGAGGENDRGDGKLVIEIG